MLRYFRINDPYRLFGLLALFLLIQLPLFIDPAGITFPELKSMIVGEKIVEGNTLYVDLVDTAAPLAGWFNGLISLLVGRSLFARHLLALIIVFFQASYVGVVFANKKAFAENTYIPSLLFILLFSYSFDTLSLTPELVGSTFLLPALNNLFKEIEFREQRNESIFNLGLYISIASLFTFSYTIFIAGALLTLGIFTRNNARKYLLLLFGFLLPHLLLASSYYLIDGVSPLWRYYYFPNLGNTTIPIISTPGLWVLGAIPGSYFLLSLVMMTREARLSKYQNQLVQSMWFWMFFSMVQTLLSKEIRPQNFVTVIPALSFFITHFLLLIRRRKFAESHIWILMVGIVLITYSSRYGGTKVNYRNLIVAEQESSIRNMRVLALDDDRGIYKQNRLATPFFNWTLSKEIFLHPEYFENIITVYDGLAKDPPDIIRDKNNLMKPFLERIPELRNQYYRSGIYYNRRSVNN